MSRKQNRPGPDISESNGMMSVWVPIAFMTLLSLIYTAGWSFAYYYFDRFSLGLIGLDIPREYFFLYAFWAVKQNLWLFFLGIIAASLLWGAAWFYLRKKPAVGYGVWAIRKTAAFVLALLLAVCLFPVFYYSGKAAATDTYKKQAEAKEPFPFPSYPGVKVWMTGDGKKNIEPLEKEWEAGCYRLLLNNKDKLYLFYPAGVNDKIPVDVIPMSRVKAFRVLPAPETCGD